MTRTDCEVVVVGASISGAQTALRLARAGVTTRVLESHTAPRAKVCGEGLHPAGCAMFRDALGEEIDDLGVPLRGFAFTDERPLMRLDHTGGELGLGCDRLLVEQRLWRALDEHPSIDFCRGETARGIDRSGDAWVVNATDEHRARFVVAADGVHSRMRQWAGRDRRTEHGRWGIRQRFRFDRPVPTHVQISFRGDGEVFVTPLPGGRISVAVLGNEERIRQLRDSDAFAEYVRPIDTPDHVVMHHATPLDEPQLWPHRGRDARPMYQQGLLLAGDAAAFVDPISGAGMTLAALSAKVVADTIVTSRSTADGRTNAALEQRAERQFRRALRPFERLSWFLRALSRSKMLRRTSTAVLARNEWLLTRLSRPTTAQWALRATADVAHP